MRRKNDDRNIIFTGVFDARLLIVLHLPQMPTVTFIEYLKRAFVMPYSLVGNICSFHKGPYLSKWSDLFRERWCRKQGGCGKGDSRDCEFLLALQSSAS